MSPLVIFYILLVLAILCFIGTIIVLTMIRSSINKDINSTRKELSDAMFSNFMMWRHKSVIAKSLLDGGIDNAVKQNLNDTGLTNPTEQDVLETRKAIIRDINEGTNDVKTRQQRFETIIKNMFVIINKIHKSLTTIAIVFSVLSVFFFIVSLFFVCST